jgi:ribosomal protein S6
MAKETNTEINLDASIYEVGYHLVPTLAEESIPAQADAVKAFITSVGGEIISEGTPTIKDLAYPISKTVKAIKSNYSKAYFGWVKFSTTPDSIEKIKTSLDASEVVVRYLLISTVKESTLMADKEKRPARPGAAARAETDKAIDELVINN